MITVRVIRCRGRSEKSIEFKWGEESGAISGDHPLNNLFTTNGTYGISVQKDKEGEYYYKEGTPHFYRFTKRGKELDESFGICKSFAQGALGRGKKFVVGAYYNLKVEKVNKQTPKIAKTGGGEGG